MTDNEKLLRQAEGLAGYRRVMLVVNALSYIGWITTFSLGMTGFGNVPQTLLIMISLAILPVWAISLIALIWGIARAARDRKLGALIDDERTLGVSHRAFQVGYWLLMAATGGCYAASFFFDIDMKLILPALVGLGVAAPSLTYAALYRS